MERTATPNFENAARYDRELTDRQREVLRLIAGEKTNAEIAESLGMTLAGAKWHVSELLSKLALDSREAAAEYYRWREAPRRRMTRAMRGLVSAGMSKAGLGVAGGLAVAAVGVVVISAISADEPDLGPALPGLPFYMEATFTRTEADYSYDAARRYWYEDTVRQRVELDGPVLTRVEPGSGITFGSGTSTSNVIVRDGAQEWRDTGKFHQGTDLSKYTGARQSIIGSRLGPISERSVDEFVERLRRDGTENLFGGSSTTTVEVRVIGSAKLLDRPVEKVELIIRDASGNSIGRRGYWVDPERLLILRHDSRIVLEGGGTLEESEVATTKLTYDAAHMQERFVFVPSTASIEITCDNPGPEYMQTGLLPSPFLNVPRDALPGLAASGFGTQVADDGTCSVGTVEFVPGPGMEAAIRVRQEAVNIDSVFSSPPSEPVDLGGGIEARLGDTGEGGRSVSWVARGVGIEVRSASMADDALLEFARAIVAANP